MYDVVTIGTATKDVFLRPPKLEAKEGRIIIEPGSKVEIASPVFSNGGGAINTAVTFARHNLKTAALFRVGKDRSGDDIVEDLKHEGVECWDVRDAEHSTGYTSIFLFPNGERTAFVYRGAAEDIPIEGIPFGKLRAKWVYIVPTHIEFGTMKKIVEHCYYQGTSIAMNPSEWYLEQRAKRLRSLLDKIKVLMVNREEAAYITGMPRERERDIFKKFDQMIDGIAVMTDGPNGVWVSDGNHMYYAGIFPGEKVVDRTGAGDAFGSGFVTGLLTKENMEYAIRLGAANATSVVESIGAHAGVLTKHAFERDSRWKNFEIKLHDLHS